MAPPVTCTGRTNEPQHSCTILYNAFGTHKGCVIEWKMIEAKEFLEYLALNDVGVFVSLPEVTDDEAPVIYYSHVVSLLANLRCQLLSNRAGGKLLDSINDGVHTLLLIYASKGIPMVQLLQLPHIQNKMVKKGLDPQVATVMGADTLAWRHDLSWYTNRWVLLNLGLGYGLVDGQVPFEELRMKRITSDCSVKIQNILLTEIMVEEEDETLTLEALSLTLHTEIALDAIAYITSQGLLDRPLGEGLGEFLHDRDAIAMFWEHYHFLSGGKLGVSPGPEELPEVTAGIPWNNKKVAVVAAIHVYMLLATESDPQPGRYLIEAQPNDEEPEPNDPDQGLNGLLGNVTTYFAREENQDSGSTHSHRLP